MRHQVLFRSLLGSVAEDNPIVGLIGFIFEHDEQPSVVRDADDDDDPRGELIN